MALSPSPLRSAATFSFTTTRTGVLKLGVFDAGGRRVQILMDEATQPAGRYEISVNDRAATGERLRAGVYLHRLEAAEGVLRGRFVILD